MRTHLPSRSREPEGCEECEECEAGARGGGNKRMANGEWQMGDGRWWMWTRFWTSEGLFQFNQVQCSKLNRGPPHPLSFSLLRDAAMLHFVYRSNMYNKPACVCASRCLQAPAIIYVRILYISCISNINAIRSYAIQKGANKQVNRMAFSEFRSIAWSVKISLLEPLVYTRHQPVDDLTLTLSSYPLLTLLAVAGLPF